MCEGVADSRITHINDWLWWLGLVIFKTDRCCPYLCRRPLNLQHHCCRPTL